MNTTPVSRTPRRLTMEISRSIVRQSDRVCGCSDGTAEINAPTPAEIPTPATRT